MNGELLRQAKRQAAVTNRTLTAFIEDAVRMMLAERPQTTTGPVEVITSKGAPLPGVDIDDTASLYARMEEP
jgi:hypothetical protein